MLANGWSWQGGCRAGLNKDPLLLEWRIGEARLLQHRDAPLKKMLRVSLRLGSNSSSAWIISLVHQGLVLASPVVSGWLMGAANSGIVVAYRHGCMRLRRRPAKIDRSVS